MVLAIQGVQLDQAERLISVADDIIRTNQHGRVSDVNVPFKHRLHEAIEEVIPDESPTRVAALVHSLSDHMKIKFVEQMEGEEALTPDGLMLADNDVRNEINRLLALDSG